VASLGAALAALGILAARGPAASPDAPAPHRSVTALGRIAPKHGLLRVAGPSLPVVVIWRLLVDEGHLVRAGQRIAILDTFLETQAALAQAAARVAAAQAELGRMEAERSNAEAQERRQERLYREGLLPPYQKEEAQLRLQVATAAVERARAELESARADRLRAEVEHERTQVRSPVAGYVVKIQAREGERVGASGIAELARAGDMYAVAEVYETDIGRVQPGQRAVVRSPSLKGQLTGTVERIGMKIGRQAVLAIDPASSTDARVVEVEIRLDDGRSVASLTHMQVEVVIETP
jgi:HlyD family secretion protein